MHKFLIGAAMAALVATGAVAKPGGGEGRSQEQAAESGSGKGRGGDGGKRAGAMDRGGDRTELRGQREKRSDKQTAGAERRADRASDQAMRQLDRGESRAAIRSDPRGNRGGNGSDRLRLPLRRDSDARVTGISPERRRGLIEGCPPGLAKKGNGCMPPGLAKKLTGAGAGLAAASIFEPSWFGYEDDYRYHDGYLLQTSGDSVLGYVPLLGGALSPGSVWPSRYEPVPVPEYWENYYDLDDDRYRYHDNVLYEVNPATSQISAIAALLTGDSFAIGNPLPTGYDVYNVPPAYRDRYYDGPDHAYRYADGYIYDVDPKTRLIQAAIQLLT